MCGTLFQKSQNTKSKGNGKKKNGFREVGKERIIVLLQKNNSESKTARNLHQYSKHQIVVKWTTV